MSSRVSAVGASVVPRGWITTTVPEEVVRRSDWA